MTDHRVTERRPKLEAAARAAERYERAPELFEPGGDRQVVGARERRRDLGVPDAVWWTGTTMASAVVGIAAGGALIGRVGSIGAGAALYAILTGGIAFATLRWGDRQHRLGHAARKTIVAIPALLAIGALEELARALVRSLAGGAP